jgi:hypothetical protein
MGQHGSDIMPNHEKTNREKIRSFGAHTVSFVSEAEIFDTFLLKAA